MSRVGTKNEVGAMAMRSRNLVQGVNELERYLLPVLYIRVVSGNAVVQCDFILFTIKVPRLTPTQLMHLFRECVLSKNLFGTAISPRKKRSVSKRPTAPTRSSENGRSSLYALRTFLNLTSGRERARGSASI